jgi:hypothetical protein
MIKRSLNRYTETITIDYALRGATDSDFQILNILDQVKTEIATQSHSLFQSGRNKNDQISDDYEKDFNDLIKIQNTCPTLVNLPHYKRMSCGYRNLAKINPLDPQDSQYDIYDNLDLLT